MNTLHIALVQIGAGTDIERNLSRVESLCAAMKDTDLIVLPEVFAIRGADADYRSAAQPLDGPVVSRVAGIAKEKGAWLLAGSVIEKDGHHIYNSSVLIDREGKIVAVYRKIHLFEANLENGRTIREADAYEAGDTPVTAELDGWKVGLSICYDLRFPELFRRYSLQKADLLLIPSNFTQRTGRDHWQVLTRARAIENQCFVVAPNQCGTNPVTGVESYGHSIVVAPWGEVLAEAGDEETVLRLDLDPALLAEARSRVPALNHARLLT